MKASSSDNPQPLYNALFVVRLSISSVILSVMLIGNVLTLCAVWITPRLRVKAYALATSLTVSNVLWTIVQVDWIVLAILGVDSCSLTLYKVAVRPIKRCIGYATYVHVSVIAVDRYIAVMHPLQYENRVTPTTPHEDVQHLQAVLCAGLRSSRTA